MPQGDFFMVLGGVFASWLLGMYQGYIIGKTRKVTRSEAASILAKASWARRVGGGYTR